MTGPFRHRIAHPNPPSDASLRDARARNHLELVGGRRVLVHRCERAGRALRLSDGGERRAERAGDRVWPFDARDDEARGVR